MSAVDTGLAHPSPRPPLRRRWWLAAFLSLLLPGLGQLYAGRWQRAIAFVTVIALFKFPISVGLWSFADLLQQPGGFWLSASIEFGIVFVRLVAIVDAALVARRASQGSLADYQRWYIYLAILFAWNAADTIGAYYPAFGTENYSIPSGSMLPTLQVGDHVIGVALSEAGGLPPRGAIVTHVDATSGDTYVRRLIGLPGDIVEIHSGRLILNGVPVPSEAIGPYRDVSGVEFEMVRETLSDGTGYTVLDKGSDMSLDDMPPLTVPPGHVFLLGDNRDNSSDDRVSGPTPIEDLETKVLYVYWSRDLARIGERVN